MVTKTARRKKTLPGLALAMLLVLVWPLWACNTVAPEGDVSGTLQASSCKALQEKVSYVLRAGYATMRLKGRVVELRLQRYPGSPTDPDLVGSALDILLLEIQRPDKIKVNEAIAIVPTQVRRSTLQQPEEWEKVVGRGQLFLGHTCPESVMPYVLQGSLTFSSFGMQKGDQIEISRLTLQLTALRPEQTNTTGELEGRFAFQYHPPDDFDKDYPNADFPNP